MVSNFIRFKISNVLGQKAEPMARRRGAGPREFSDHCLGRRRAGQSSHDLYYDFNAS
jgi:hypothetical protein